MSEAVHLPLPTGSLPGPLSPAEQDAAVERFKAFLRLRTITAEVPTGAGKLAIAHLTAEAQALGLSYQTHEYVPGYPVFVCTWTGSDPSLPSILLNSHYDVVPGT